MSVAVTWLQNSLGVDLKGEWARHVHLNVGGIPYTTRRHTLRSLKDNRVFGPILNGTAHRCENGSFLIDRDGALFRFIIAHLRDGRLYLPEDFNEWELLLQEVRYYDLPELEKTVLDRFEYQRSVFRQQLPPCVYVWWSPTGAVPPQPVQAAAVSTSAPAPSSAPCRVAQEKATRETGRLSGNTTDDCLHPGADVDRGEGRQPSLGVGDNTTASDAATQSPSPPSCSSSICIVPPLPGLTVRDSACQCVLFRETQVLQDLDQLVMVLLSAYGFVVQHWDAERGRVFLTLPASF